jgi:hypothetical protein
MQLIPTHQPIQNDERRPKRGERKESNYPPVAPGKSVQSCTSPLAAVWFIDPVLASAFPVDVPAIDIEHLLGVTVQGPLRAYR